MEKKTEREVLFEQIVSRLSGMGYPESFGRMIAGSLGTEMTMRRMLQYLHAAKPESAEDIADEMLAILSDRDRWREKKINEHYNSKLNAYLRYGFGEEDE